MSAAELRAELKALRKEHPDHAPVSKMKKKDVSELIQRLKAGREETPAVASITAAPPKMNEMAVESMKKVKASDVPLATAVAEKAPKKAPAKPKKEVVASAVKASKAKEVALKANGAAAGAPIPRPAKGSEEMKARMAAIRTKRSKKDE